MTDYLHIFNQLRYNPENEVVEFKRAEHNFDFDELGKYFSALSNEANLHQKEYAWIIFGVHDKSREIIGTSFKDSEQALNKLKQDISQLTTDNLTFHAIVPLMVENRRVLIFQIPAGPHNSDSLERNSLWKEWRELCSSKSSETRHYSQSAATRRLVCTVSKGCYYR